MNVDSATEVRNLGQGLWLLAQLGQPTYFRTINGECAKYQKHLRRYPFLFRDPPSDSQKILFLGAGATDISVEVFVVCIRARLGYVDGTRPSKLRVIDAPYCAGCESDQKHVFFEIRFDDSVLISGETTNFSGAGNAARNELEDVFALLSRIYDLRIERESLRCSANSHRFV